ncbi:MAG: tripartite tricarboxylate transporter TctB family protein [Natronospirillum sp.]
MSQITHHKVRIDWGHLFVVTLVVAACVWYLLDARGASLRITNLIFVQPAALFAVILYLLILPQCFHRVGGTPSRQEAETNEPGEERQNLTLRQFLRVTSLAVAFGVFVFSMETFGFDVSAWLFVTIGLFISGERRWWVLSFFPLIFTGLIVYGYSMLIPYPFPTSIL